MKFLVYLPLLFFGTKAISQTTVFVDSLTGQPVEFVGIRTDNDGFYSDRFGRIDKNIINHSNISVFHLAYGTKYLKPKDIRDTILLIPKPIALNEVEVSNRKKLVEIQPGKQAGSFGSWVLRPKEELIVHLFPEQRYIGAKLINISIPIAEKREIEQKDGYAYLRVNIRGIRDSIATDVLFVSKPIKIKANDKDVIELDVSDYSIVFEENGISVGVELIGYYDENELLIDSSTYVRPVLTKKRIKDFRSETHYRFFFEDAHLQKRINSYLGQGFPKYQNVERSLSVGLVMELIGG